MSGLYIFSLAIGAPLLLWMVFVGDADGGEGIGADFDGDGDMTVVPLTAIAAFMATFGGIGVIGELTGAGFGATLVLALMAAVLVGAASRQLLKWAKGSGVSSEVTDMELEGRLARVSLPVSAEFRGKIVLEAAGAREQMTAATVDGSTMEVGESVVVVRIENGVALVAPMTGELSPE